MLWATPKLLSRLSWAERFWLRPTSSTHVAQKRHDVFLLIRSYMVWAHFVLFSVLLDIFQPLLRSLKNASQPASKQESNQWTNHINQPIKQAISQSASQPINQPAAIELTEHHRISQFSVVALPFAAPHNVLIILAYYWRREWHDNLLNMSAFKFISPPVC